MGRNASVIMTKEQVASWKPGDTLLVCEAGDNRRVQALRVHRKQAGGEIARLTFAAKFGSVGDGPGQFKSPFAPSPCTSTTGTPLPWSV